MPSVRIIFAHFFLCLFIPEILYSGDGKFDNQVGEAKSITDSEISKLADLNAKGEPQNTDQSSNTESKQSETETKETESDQTRSLTEEEEPISDAEMDMLQNLKSRHAKLLEWEKQLSDKENMVNALASSVDAKINELENAKKELDPILAQYKKANSEKTMSLVKVYENMRPQEAAQIFADLEMNTLLDLLGKMQETKLSAIMEKMRADRAREITIKLANARKIPKLESECYCKE